MRARSFYRTEYTKVTHLKENVLSGLMNNNIQEI